MNNRELACKIADYLFTNGAGKHARRLVLEMPDLKSGGGWIESAVARVIEEHLEAAQQSGEHSMNDPIAIVATSDVAALIDPETLQIWMTTGIKPAARRPKN